MITATYEMERVVGTIGVLGPTRTDYGCGTLLPIGKHQCFYRRKHRLKPIAARAWRDGVSNLVAEVRDDPWPRPSFNLYEWLEIVHEEEDKQ